MGLAEIKRELIRELRTEHSQEILEEASRRHMVFMWNEPETFATALREARDEVRRRVLASIIKEQQSGLCGEVWNALLIVAFYPMLVHLRMQLNGNGLPGRELDQLVIEKFLEATEQTSFKQVMVDGIGALRCEMRRLVFAAVRAERRARKEISVIHLEGMEDAAPEYPNAEEAAALSTECLWPEFRRQFNPPPEFASEDLKELTLKITMAKKLIRWEHVDAVIATHLRGERLTEYVKKKYPGLSESEIRRFYERAKRTHSRTVHRLRELYVTRNCSDSEQGCLLPWWEVGDEEPPLKSRRPRKRKIGKKKNASPEKQTKTEQNQ